MKRAPTRSHDEEPADNRLRAWQQLVREEAILKVVAADDAEAGSRSLMK